MRERVKKLLRRLAREFFRIYYYGHSYQCPLCHSHLRMFLPYGDDHPLLKKMKVLSAGRRPNALCPVCGSLDRDRLLYLYLLHKTSAFHKTMKLLHVAPERALQRILSRQGGLDYVTADLSRDDVMVKADLNNLPFPGDSFDAVICNHVFEYIPDDRRAMAEIHRVLKPGGWAILLEQIALSLETTLEDPLILTRSERYAAYGEPDHVRLYGKDYHRRIEQVGFLVEVFKWSTEDGSFGGPGNTFGLLEGESVYVAFKPG
jgi:SAM-dependent methyltransferase